MCQPLRESLHIRPSSGASIVSAQTSALIGAETGHQDHCRSAQPMSPTGQTRMSPERSHVSFRQLRTSRRVGSGRLRATIADPRTCSKQPLYSITSSARSSTDVGMSIPSALAVLRLRMVSNFVARSSIMGAQISASERIRDCGRNAQLQSAYFTRRRTRRWRRKGCRPPPAAVPPALHCRPLAAARRGDAPLLQPGRRG
jgi:hypothetical protein